MVRYKQFGEIQVNETKKKTILDTMNEVQDLETKYEKNTNTTWTLSKEMVYHMN